MSRVVAAIAIFFPALFGFVIENDRERLAAFRRALVSASDGRLSLVQTPVRD